ncbi:hypothetical protein IVB69_05395 [Flavobacterium sp. J49]|uniref:hypothetical protein n=1 Tax=Flavobacterium sp. J49 TaxID=2718534 RepID=UPI0015942573|nr:hypothetical protein [Flavobacterium sp. J49]MBF6640905.1 hypothetical protein [Flavobacterium sp. J49]NIC02152.1 hypothetical protein [Flavobacterium sp. J49]
MKKETDLSTLTTEELEKRAKNTKTASVMLAVIIAIQFGIGLFLTVSKGFNVFTFIPLAFLPMLIVNFTNIKKIKEEIAKRNS